MSTLSWVIFSPIAGAVLLTALRSDNHRGLGRAALLFSLAPFVISLAMLAEFQVGNGDFQMVERAAWIPAWGIQYHVGVDGVSLFLVLLTTFLTPIVILASIGEIHHRPKEYYVSFLLLETGMLGTLLALDLFLFYVFWELMLVPMFLLIGVWGGARRIYATIKFVLFTMVGSLLMLVAILYMGWRVKAGATHQPGFGYEQFLQLQLSPTEQLYLFAAFALAFAIKVPLFPLHTWLPDAHTEAPTGGSVILAGVLLKMGTYGFLRFAMPFFPGALATVLPWLVALAVIGIIYGALVATVQPDLKKLVAYSSVSHLGFVMLGLAALTPISVTGSVYQMLNHGLSTGALFLAVGMIYERRHTRLIKDFGGLWSVMPIYAVCFLIAMLASVGLPGLNGFLGEFLILLGSFKVWPWPTALASTGVILGALYLLWMFQRVIFGPVVHEQNRVLKDLSAREIAVFVPVLVLCLVMGVSPGPFFPRIEPSVQRMLTLSHRATAAATVVSR